MENTSELFLIGNELTETEFSDLQRRLEVDSQDLKSRLTMIGYLTNHYGVKNNAATLKAHVLWLIDRLPADSEWIFSYPEKDPHYFEICEKWLKKAKELWNDTAVLRNAASFNSTWNPLVAERCLLRAQEVDPSNEEWPYLLAVLYMSTSQNMESDSAQRRSNANAAIENANHALELHQHTPTFPYLEAYLGLFLTNLAEFAISTQQYAAAKEYAHKLIALGSSTKPHTPSVGTNFVEAACLHSGHALAGRASLREGQLELAKESLRAIMQAPVPRNKLLTISADTSLINELMWNEEHTLAQDYFRYVLAQAEEAERDLTATPPRISQPLIDYLNRSAGSHDKLIAEWLAPLRSCAKITNSYERAFQAGKFSTIQVNLL